MDNPVIITTRSERGSEEISNSINTSIPDPVSNTRTHISPSDVIRVSEASTMTKKEFVTKSLKEKLLMLRNPLNLKNQLNLKTPLNLPSTNKTLNQKMASSGVFKNDNNIQVNPVSRVVPSVNKLVEEVDSAMEVELVNDENQSPEEEGQEIEFSENDLSRVEFNINDNSSDGLLSPNYMENDTENNSTGRNRAVSTDDEDLPLAHLKGDSNEEAVDVKPAKKVKGSKSSRKSNDSLPLSIVAASLKKTEENDESTGKGKKKTKGKGKKRKKDAREPIR